MVAMFDTQCPSGWSLYEPMTGRFPRGSTNSGMTGGQSEHTHDYDITARTSKDGEHLHLIDQGEKVNVDTGNFGHIGIYKGNLQAFEEAGRARSRMPRAKAITDTIPAHDHFISITGNSEKADHLPPYLEIVFCRKD